MNEKEQTSLARHIGAYDRVLALSTEDAAVALTRLAPALAAPDLLTSMGSAWRVVEALASKMGYGSLGYAWDGPLYKPKDRYLTAEGWPLGTVCWFVEVSSGHERQRFCAGRPEEAVVRAALWACWVMGWTGADLEVR